MALYVGLDVGTQGAKAVVYNGAERRIVSRGSYSWSILPSEVPGRAEQEPATWIQGGLSAIREALDKVDRSQVRAIGVSGQQHGLVALGKDKKVLRNAKIWCDTESAPEAEELSRLLGRTLVPSYTITKVMWLKHHEPETYQQLAHILLPHDYFNFFLTGQLVTECGDASGTGVFDVHNRCWDLGALQQVDPWLIDKFPTIIGHNDIVGTLTPEAAEKLQLDSQVIVSPGSGDNAMSAIGAGAVTAGQTIISLGTSGTIFGKSSVPVTDSTCTVCAFCDATGSWLPLVCTLNCTLVAEEVRNAYGLGREEITALAEKEAPGCEGVNFLPYLVGERTPNWPSASGCVLGLRTGSLRPGLMYRAALEGATFSLLAGTRAMMDQGLVPSELRLVGGGSKNKLWRQMIADVFQLPVRLPLEPESAALGAALQAAAVHSGVDVSQYVALHPPPLAEEVVEPNPALKQVYESAFQRHVEGGQLLFDRSR